MGLLKAPIQRRLSSLLGAEVTIDKLNLSLIGGVLDARGVTISGDDPATPLLTLQRVRAEVSVGRALKGEILIKSLTFERPIVRIVRRADGSMNLPRRLNDDLPEPDPPKPARAESIDPSPEDATGWKLDLTKLLLVDGELHFRQEFAAEAPYELSAKPILAEARRNGNGFAFTCIVSSLERALTGAKMNEIKLSGRADNVEDLTQLKSASLHANLDVDGQIKGRADVKSLSTLKGSAGIDGQVDLRDVHAWMPPNLKRLPGIGGQVTFRIDAERTDRIRIQLRELRLADGEVTL